MKGSELSKDAHKLLELSKGIKLLYVEDDDDARKTTLNLLHNFFDNIVVAVDGYILKPLQLTQFTSTLLKIIQKIILIDVQKNYQTHLEEDRVKAVYQGIVDSSGRIVKYETLMRLEEKDTKKLQSPYFFLDVAIKTRLYSYLSSRVIFKALDILKNSDEVLSVNFTYSDIKNTSLIEKIEAFISENKNIGSRLIVEITEDESIENYDDVKAFIGRFRSYGVKIAIDDFGTGFSNFEYILEVEPDYLKIDGSLVKDIDTNKRSFTLVEAIVQFSHKLGIKVIAEFVHSKTIFEMLKDLSVDEYQGFYFHEPKLTLVSNDDNL